MAILRIVLADDHKVLREQIRSLINSQSDMVVAGEAPDGHVALQQVRQLQPELLVLDISMPELSGLRVLEQIKAEDLRVRVLILSVFGETAFVRQLLAAGAGGYLLKKAAAEELPGAIRLVAAGGTYVDASMSRKIATVVEPQALRPATAGDKLTDLEREMICQLALGYTYHEIATHLNISLEAFLTYKTRILAKLSLQSRAQIARFAIAQGWI
jgi:two-component system response regulator NreC